MLALAVGVKRNLSRLRTVLQSDLFWKGLRPLETLTVFMNRMLFRESKGVLNRRWLKSLVSSSPSRVQSYCIFYKSFLTNSHT